MKYEAAEAIRAIESEPARHAEVARRIAAEYLDSSVVLPEFLESCGVEPLGATPGG